MKSKKNAFTLIELLAIIVILAIIAVITVPIILNIIENSRLGAVKDSAYGYKDAINKYYVTDLSENPESNLKLSGTYIVQEDGTLKGMNVEEKTYTDNLEIPLSGTTPTGGYLNYENNTLKDGCLTIDEYKLTIENGEVKNTEKGKCNGMSLTACDSSNFHPSPENWFTFDETTNTITGFSESWDGTTDITIPCSINGKEVKEIGTGAFEQKSLTGVVISDSVIIINAGAFNKNQISKLLIGYNVEEIRNFAFNSNKIEKIIIPNNVKILSAQSFSQNSSNATLSLGKNVKTIGSSAFASSNLVGKLELPNSIENIEASAFNTNQLTEIVINSGTVGSGAFNQNRIKKLTIGDNVSKISSGAFYDDDLEIINILSKNVQIEAYSFSKSTGRNENLTIINNKSGKAFDWGLIINGESGYNFETGTVVNSLGNVEVIK